MDLSHLSPAERVEVGKVYLEAILKFALEAIRWSLVINGAAATAMVAFLPHAKSAGLEMPSVACAILAFGYGTFFGAVGFGASYLAQVFAVELTKVWLFQTVRVVAILVVLGAYACFLVGIREAAGSIR